MGKRAAAGFTFTDRASDATAAIAYSAPEILPLGRERAGAIAAGARPLDVLGGDKTRAFYRAITGDREAVTVDVWAARAALGDWISLTPKRYGRISAAYKAAARRLGEDPRTVQATVWLVARGVKPSDPNLVR